MSTDTKSKVSNLLLEGELGVADAYKLLARLKKSAARGVDVNIEAGEVRSVDTAILQLLLAFNKDVQASGCQVHWKSFSEPLLSAIDLAGLSKELAVA